jgi:hypothetical protein
MPRWLKVILIVVGSGLVLLGLGVGAVVWWLQSHREELLASGKRAENEGQAFAQGKDSNGCLHEAVARLSTTSGISQEVTLRIFLTACLKAVPHEPALCVGVPEESEIMQTVAWRVQTCKDQGKAGDDACARLMAGVQSACH